LEQKQLKKHAPLSFTFLGTHCRKSTLAFLVHSLRKWQTLSTELAKYLVCRRHLGRHNIWYELSVWARLNPQRAVTVAAVRDAG
jgi:hypothetical protein